MLQTIASCLALEILSAAVLLLSTHAISADENLHDAPLFHLPYSNRSSIYRDDYNGWRPANYNNYHSYPYNAYYYYYYYEIK